MSRGCAALLTIAMVTLSACAGEPSTAPTEPAARTPHDTVPVDRRDLTTTDDLDGLLGYGEEQTLAAPRGGTLTRLAHEGATVRRGQPLYRIDDAATMLLYGTTPSWRGLAVGVSDGADVRQLERNLAALGYFDTADDAPDRHFDWRTRQAVRDWQDDRGVDATGELALGDVVFLPGAVRIGAHQIAPGAAVTPGQAVTGVTGTTQVVTLELTPQERELVRRRQKVAVELPNGDRVRGRVASIGRVATIPDGEDAEATVKAEVSLDHDVTGLDAAPVTVHVTRTLASDVLAVPVGALVALAEGGYAVELVTPAGTELVAVETGEFTDTMVEVTGEIAQGDEVVVPS